MNQSDSQIKADQEFMSLALLEAKRAQSIGEVPIGALVVCDGEIIASAYNRREIDADPSAHAEFLAITRASAKLNRWRLSDCTVYVTLEPCLMCAGLMQQARVSRVVYAAPDPKGGALGSLYSLHKDERLNHRFEVSGGVLEEDSARLLKDFFAMRREQNRIQKAAKADGFKAAPLQTHKIKRPSWMFSEDLDEETVEQERIYEGFIFDIDRLHVRLPDGKLGERDVLRHSGAAAVLAIDNEDNVLLTRQWRSALGRVNTEIPAGKIDPGETPLEAAVREFAEEAQLCAGKIEHLTSVTTSAGFADELLHIFVARDLKPCKADMDREEFIELVWVPFHEALYIAQHGIIEDAKTVVALLLEHNRRKDLK